MAHKATAVLLLLIAFHVLLAFAGRDIPPTFEAQDMKQAEFLHEGTVLIPGLGRVMIPPKRHHHFNVNPFTYNPVTGTGGGPGFGGTGGPGHGTIGGGPGSRDYIPGGDDTFVPNPGYEVPIPGRGGSGSIPAPVAARP
ncbi:hypothetical protein NMG60_11035553 [Bertholletia excelsa]